MAERGFVAPGFRNVVHAGGGHNETDWQRQMAKPLQHLLGTSDELELRRSNQA